MKAQKIRTYQKPTQGCNFFERLQIELEDFGRRVSKKEMKRILELGSDCKFDESLSEHFQRINFGSEHIIGHTARAFLEEALGIKLQMHPIRSPEGLGRSPFVNREDYLGDVEAAL